MTSSCEVPLTSGDSTRRHLLVLHHCQRIIHSSLSHEAAVRASPSRSQRFRFLVPPTPGWHPSVGPVHHSHWSMAQDISPWVPLHWPLLFMVALPSALLGQPYMGHSRGHQIGSASHSRPRFDTTTVHERYFRFLSCDQPGLIGWDTPKRRCNKVPPYCHLPHQMRWWYPSRMMRPFKTLCKGHFITWHTSKGGLRESLPIYSGESCAWMDSFIY